VAVIHPCRAPEPERPAAPRSRGSLRTLAALALICTAVGARLPTLLADTPPDQAALLVSKALSALASRDGPALARLYAAEPYLVCTDMDRVARAEIAGKRALDTRYSLSNFTTSLPTPLSAPRAAALPGGRTAVTFSFRWDYQLAGDHPQSATIVVSWIVGPDHGSLKILSQRTYDPDEIGPGCGP
jgi:hypothetical protein